MTAPAPLEFFDVHQHVGALIGVPGVRPLAASVEDDVQARLAFMDRFDIRQCALMPGHSYSAPNGAADVRKINDALLAYRRCAPDRFAVVAGTVDPRHGGDALAEVERLRAEGVQALSWHHRMQGLPMDHPAMFRIVERMARGGMVAMAHCYAHGDFEAPWRLRRLAEAFPQTAFVALDAMTSPENLEQLLGAAEVLPNLYLDQTTSFLGVSGIRRCVERLGPSRLMFGTNYYSTGRRETLEDRELLVSALEDPAALARVAGDNARRLFGLAPTAGGR